MCLPQISLPQLVLLAKALLEYPRRVLGRDHALAAAAIARVRAVHFAQSFLNRRDEGVFLGQVEPGEREARGGHAAEERGRVVGLGRGNLLSGDEGAPEGVGAQGLRLPSRGEEGV